MTIQKILKRLWLRCERVRRASFLICVAAGLAACGSIFSAQTVRSAPNAAQGPIRVQLFDVYSGLVIANAAVEVTSDNGIQCEQAPCPSNGQTWSGRSDDAGVITIPRSAIQFDTYVRTNDHRSVKLPDDATNGSSDTRQIELYPEWLYSEQYDWTRGYKLVDARSGKVLANTPVRIVFPANDWPAQHGGINSLDVKTNPLGYVFFSFLRKPEPKYGQTLLPAPLADWVTPEVWAAVSGYQKAKLNYFEGNYAERFTTRLQRQ